MVEVWWRCDGGMVVCMVVWCGDALGLVWLRSSGVVVF